MLSGRFPLRNSKPGHVYKVEMFYLLQFFQLRKHTCLPDDLPPRGLALGCDVPGVATATGKSILIVLKPKSKGNAITLNWKRMETERENVSEYPGTLYAPCSCALEIILLETIFRNIQE